MSVKPLRPKLLPFLPHLKVQLTPLGAAHLRGGSSGGMGLCDCSSDTPAPLLFLCSAAPTGSFLCALHNHLGPMA